MSFKNHQSKSDRNFRDAVIGCLKYRCAGYWKDKSYPHHYAHLRGLLICAYDTNKMGSGFPDTEIWVSWLCLHFEVKQQRSPTKHIDAATDEAYYKAQLEESEVFFRRHHSSLVPIVWDREQVFTWLQAMADFVMYVEGKAEGSKELLALFFPKAWEAMTQEKDQ